MYEVDEKDRVVPLEGVPQSSIGAPLPFVAADEHTVVLAFYIENKSPDWDGTSIRLVYRASGEEPVALVRFSGSRTHMFGPPNDEAFSGHPLASRGLHPYGAFEILDSSWIRKLERINSVHEHHRPERFAELHHFIFAFHDSTFECVCREFAVTTTRGSTRSVIPEVLKLLQWHST